MNLEEIKAYVNSLIEHELDSYTLSCFHWLIAEVERLQRLNKLYEQKQDSHDRFAVELEKTTAKRCAEIAMNAKGPWIQGDFYAPATGMDVCRAIEKEFLQ